MIGNWQNFRTPFEPMRNFLRSEPFPTDEEKATAIDHPGKKTPRKKRRGIHPGRAHAALSRRA